MTAALACMTCGAELRSSAKFCDECGSPIAEPGTPTEYKQVTVLFADVVHSMDIALRLRVGLNSGQVMPGRSVRVRWVTPQLVSRWAWPSGWSLSRRPAR